MNATAREVEVYRAWKKGHPGYPLTVHPSGQWSKKIRGKTCYFGRLSDPDEALRLWTEEREYHLAGLDPPESNGSLTIGELTGKHLADMDDRIAVGRAALSTRSRYVVAGRLLEEAGLARVPVKSIGPEHFTIAQGILQRSGRSLRTQKNLIIAVRVIFNWGRQMGLYDHSICYGPRFVVPSLNDVEAEQEENGACRFLGRELILAALAAANPKLKVAILLGINCGFYPSDTVAVTLDRLHLDGEVPYHDFRRVKNNQQRRAALWPETARAIQDYRDNHRNPDNPAERCLVLSKMRRRYGRGGSAVLVRSFNILLDSIGDRPRGTSLGSLRHTYGTVVDLVPDQAMIDLTMGHTNKSLQKRVYSQLNINELERLQAVAETVREWLFSDGNGIPETCT
jgi:integrase